MKRITKLFLILSTMRVLLTALTGVTGCATSSTTSTTVSTQNTTFTVTDDRGTTVSFTAPVNSIVSLAPSNTEVVCFTGAINKLIARTNYCNYPTAGSSIESIGGYSKPDKERIVILHPDVVLATGIHVSSGDVAWLEKQGLKVLVLDPKDIAGIMKDIIMVGELTGNEIIATQKVAELQSKMDAITASTAGLSEGAKPRTLFVTWHDPLWTQGSGAFMNDVIQMAGGKNIFSDITGDAQVDTELAVTRNPQVIIVVTAMGDNYMQSYDYITAANSPFSATDAYKNKKVFLLNSDIATRPGPRIIDALQLVAKDLHPEIFP